MTKPKWEPLFEPDSSTLTVIGDGVSKINTAVPGYFTKENLRDLTGIDYNSDINVNSQVDIKEMVSQKEQMNEGE